ncbi:MAG: hypothetical protein EA376_00455 [Phycisphaeraceae bacterium]|nr:MAG: hypothetical protein EA376_00455 [Phycisphaeraceae bacterium]
MGVGCVGYANYPPIEGAVARTDPNSAPMSDLMIESIKWTVQRFPVKGEYAINFPDGMLRKRTLQLMERIDDPRAHALTEETAHLPIYHVSRLRIRGNTADVDIHRPVGDLRGPSDQHVHQAITLRLRGGMRAWRVESSRAWTIGAIEPPALSFMPEYDTGPLGPGSETVSRPRRTTDATTEETPETIAAPDAEQDRLDPDEQG